MSKQEVPKTLSVNELLVEAIPVREFLKYSSKELLDDLSGKIPVLFEDNVCITMSANKVVVSRYFWEMFIYYKDLPLTSVYIVNNFYTNGMFTGKTHTKLLTKLNEDLIVNIFSRNNVDLHKELTTLFYRMFDLLEMLYSELSYNIIDNVSSINIIDLLEIQMVPELMDAMRNVSIKMDALSIDQAYAVLDNVIRTKKELSNNTVAKAYVSGMVNANQMKQVLGPRGYVTELDSHIFKYPIANSFTLGLGNMYELATDSRSGAKALFLSNKAIQDSEYFGRELHLATMVVEDIVFGDCGSNKYLNWYVKPREEHNGMVIYKGDLNNLVGKWYLNEETNQLEVITKNHTHLYDKTIKLRSAINCQLSDKRQVCSKCFGELSYSVPKHSNIGHMCSTEINSRISQSILSTKHLAASAVSASLTTDKISSKFFTIKNAGYVLREPIIKSKDKISIIVSQEECFGLKDIRPNKSINHIDPGRVSRIESFTIKVEPKDPKKSTEYFPILIKAGNRYGVFEPKFLSYIMEQGFETDDNDNYILDISRWSLSSPILKLPEVEFSFLALSKDTKDMFKTMYTYKDGTSKDSPESLLSKVFTLVNSKLDLNLALFEIVVYPFTVYDLKNGNYDLGRNSDNPQLASLLTIIDRRSAGASYGYDNLSGKILTPSLFSTKNKCDHKLDVLLAPNEVVLQHRG